MEFWVEDLMHICCAIVNAYYVPIRHKSLDAERFIAEQTLLRRNRGNDLKDYLDANGLIRQRRSGH
jgi:hypothetical protein